jgi:hypothetical protein
MKTHNPAAQAILDKPRQSSRLRVRALIPKSGLGAYRNVLTGFAKAVRFEVPLGYQDETGFHYGAKPARPRICYCGDI